MADIELIKSKLDIVEVISSYVPNVKKAGANYKALCPFHNEKTPSFTINQNLQIFKCFGCGKAGDVIKFIEEIEKVEFVEALKIAAEKAGVEIDDSYEDKTAKEERKKVIEANTLAAKYYNYLLLTHKSGKLGRDYALKRQINAEIIKKFNIGYSPEGKSNLKKFLSAKGFKEKDLEKWGLLVERNGQLIDKFRTRLLQPIYSLKGEVIGFSGRYIGTSKDAPKYLNSSETPVYKKNEILYGLYHGKDAIRKKNFVILVEGNIDPLSSHRVGIENIVAPLGTAFTPNQAKLIKRFCEEVYFSFDTDSAGTKALVRGLEILENAGLKHKVIDLTGFQDADELICKVPEEWQTRIDNAKNSFEYLLEKLSSDLNMGHLDGKTKFKERIYPVLKLIKDPVTLAHFSREVSLMLEITEDALTADLKGVEAPKMRREISENSENESTPILEQSEKIDSSELLILGQILSNHKFISEFEVDANFFVSESAKRIFIKLQESSHPIDLGEVAERLDSIDKKTFEELLLNEDYSKEMDSKTFQKVLNRTKEKMLKRKIMHLRKSLSHNSENNEALVELNRLIKELGKMRKEAGK